MFARTLAAAVAAPINLNGPDKHLQWGVLQISRANFIVIIAMIVLFVLALLLPFPKGRGRR